MKTIYWMRNQSRQEYLIYSVVWGMLFAAPLLSLYVRTVNDGNVDFNWAEVFFVWRKFSVYLLLFLAHDFFLAPLLIHRHRRWVYVLSVALVIAAFTFFQFSNRPDGKKRFGHKQHVERIHQHQPSMDEPPMEMGEHRIENPPMGEHQMEHPPMGERPQHFDEKPPHEVRRQSPPPFLIEREILPVVVLILMFGANLGMKGYFRNRRDQRKLEELEKQNLAQQLEYLKYQINPHFFMNTLNNIHALVDVDPEKAQTTILELSKMMRFMLYEGDKSGVPLTREFEFIRTYIKLMRLRYTDKVKITVDLPSEAPDKIVPPLMLISFIENAFKHGISYQHPSFIDVKVTLDGGRLHFLCSNSIAEIPTQEKGGIGLANVKKRLDLLYGQNYTLKLEDASGVYHVELIIPL